MKSALKRPPVKSTGDSKAPLRPVAEIIFGVINPEEIRHLSVTPEGIQHSQVYNTDGSPVVGGLLDPRQGVIDKVSRCQTCLGQIGDCPGHFGHIELGEPVFYANYIPKILKILRCVCFYCYKLLVPLENVRLQEILLKNTVDTCRRFSLIYGLCKGKMSCDNERVPNSSDGGGFQKRCKGICGRRQPKMKQIGLELVVEWDRLDVQDGIDPRFSRPEWMIATVLVVPPISIRPAAVTFGGVKNQDDLTYKLADIVNANNDLLSAKKEGATQVVQENHLKILQYHVATLVDNEIPGIPKSVHKSSGKVIKSLKARLNGKEGRLRGNLMGKRVDFSARTVISPDPRLRVDEVGIPTVIAKNLTFPEIVTPYNIKLMEDLVSRGPKQYPGAKYVVKPNGDRIDLRFAQPRKLRLQPGFQIERDLVDGDLVVFNRQPTLHKMSMMGHRVKVLPHTTFRMNLSCTSPYNADFDGDEMNLHVPQSLDVVAEIEQLQLTTRQIITPQSNRPAMGIVQDALTGAQKLTLRDQFMDRGTLMNLLLNISTWDGQMPRPAILKPVTLWTGKQIFSCIIPDKLNLVKSHSTHASSEDLGIYKWISPGDTKVLIVQGELLSGILCRQTLGMSSGSLLHVAMMELGHEVTGILYNDIQNVVNSWLTIQGHSIGFQDAVVDLKTETLVKEILKTAKQDIETIETREKETSCGEERKINSILNKAVCQTGSFVQTSLAGSNNLKVMVVAGSKGSLINIAQIMGCIGQLNITGQRISVHDGGRTLPHFKFYDKSPEARGFVINSFFRGIDPHEYFFQSMAGREGLIDTAVKTAETGYIQRRLMKAMESLMVQYDGTVRNAFGHVVQYCYGEDGLAGEKVEFQKLPTILLSDQEFCSEFRFDVNVCDHSYLRKVFTDTVVSAIKGDTTIKNVLKEEWEALENDRKFLRQIKPDGDASVVLPCNIRRMVWNVQKSFHIGKFNRSDLNPASVVVAVKDLLYGIKVIIGEGHHKEIANQNSTYLFSCLIRSNLCSKQVCDKYRLSKLAFDYLLNRVKATFEMAKVEPGEMVGSIAAQSIGEPATQMTLNTFHFAGVSSKNVTLGVPRFNEIINASRCPKSASMTIFLRNSADKDKAFEVLSRLECTKMKEIILETRIFFEPDILNSVIKEDQETLDSHFRILEADSGQPKNLCPWVLRMILDKKKVCNGQIKMEEVAEKVEVELQGRGFCVYSDDNAETLMFRIYVYSNFCKHILDNQHHMERSFRFIESKLRVLGIKGNPNIRTIFMRQTTAADGQKLRTVINSQGNMCRTQEWILETEGTDLLGVMADKDIDFKRIVSTDIWDVYNTLGIEAARKIIEIELRNVLQNYGLYVNYRHISVLCDVMTSKGHIVPITRHGISSLEVGPLMRCSFERTGDVLIDAAVHSERDRIRGVSESLIVGNFPKIGTGAFDLILDSVKCALVKTREVDGCRPAVDDVQRQEGSKIEPSSTAKPIMSPPLYVPSEFNYSPSSPKYSPYSPPYVPECFGMYSPVSPPYAPTSVGYSCQSPPYKSFESPTLIASQPSDSIFNPFGLQMDADKNKSRDFGTKTSDADSTTNTVELESMNYCQDSHEIDATPDPSFSPLAPAFSKYGATGGSYVPKL
ncbi:unnamed protein product [Allacma fusca]|uniref:DNA-directed RNA polymerase subunit n=1 Tax=Allacma fusca TaxID=39272 RepID=A0A8J2JY24_9HEXA|nr:unnamed protein product [Allacma fusca]